MCRIFGKAVATAFVGISNIPMVKVEIHSFSIYIKKVSIKTFSRSCSKFQFTVFEFIWIQYICTFCLVYHLKDWTYLGKVISVLWSRTCFLACKFSRKTATKFQKCVCVMLFQKFVTDYRLE